MFTTNLVRSFISTVEEKINKASREISSFNFGEALAILNVLKSQALDFSSNLEKSQPVILPTKKLETWTLMRDNYSLDQWQRLKKIPHARVGTTCGDKKEYIVLTLAPAEEVL